MNEVAGNFTEEEEDPSSALLSAFVDVRRVFYRSCVCAWDMQLWAAQDDEDLSDLFHSEKAVNTLPGKRAFEDRSACGPCRP